MLSKSASAPAFAGHSERVPRFVPPLALVPLAQLQQPAEPNNPDANARRRRRQLPDEPTSRDHHKRLGERFLAMMAQLARLQRMDLEGTSASGSDPPVQNIPPSPSALQQLKDSKRIRARERLSPQRVPQPVVNVATAPLREHLTFEISMLLPPPMDTRQSELRSPIRRRGRRPRRVRKLRRKKRPTGATRTADGRRTWHTSHATWVPHASADYAEGRARAAMAERASSKLVAKFAALRSRGGERADEGKYVVALGGGMLQQREGERTRGEVENNGDSCSESSEAGEEEEHEEEQNGPEEEGEGDDEDVLDTTLDGVDEDASDNSEEEEDTVPPLGNDRSGAAPPRARIATLPSPSASVVRPLQTHQAAWISPDLRAWLLQSGLFHSP